MLALRPRAIQASGRLPLAAAQATRQYSSPPTRPPHSPKSHDGHAHKEHGHEDHGHHHAEPTPESLGVSDPLASLFFWAHH